MNGQPAKFSFYEKVRVATAQPNKQTMNGEIGAVIGRVQDDDTGLWFYSIHIYRTDEGWDFREDELQATGEFDVYETFYDGTSVRVRVGKDGAGVLVNDSI